MDKDNKKTRPLYALIDPALYDQIELYRVKLSSERCEPVSKREVVEIILSQFFAASTTNGLG